MVQMLIEGETHAEFVEKLRTLAEGFGVIEPQTPPAEDVIEPE